MTPFTMYDHMQAVMKAARTVHAKLEEKSPPHAEELGASIEAMESWIRAFFIARTDKQANI